MQRVDILNEQMTPALFKLAWPTILSMLFQTLYNVIDAFWLGKLGKIAISAPTIAWPAIFLLISLGSGLGVAGLAMVSQYIGSGNFKKASKAAGQVILISAIFATVVGIIGGISSGGILKLMKVPMEMFDSTKIYMQTIFFGAPLTFGTFAIASLFSGWGDTVTPMVLTGLSVLFNAVLDPLMIFGIGFPRLEIFGAALATVISRGVVVVLALYILFSGRREIKLTPHDMVPDVYMIKKIFSIGFPSSLGQSVTAFAFLIIMAIISRFGPVATAAVGVGNRVTSIATMFSFGLAQATSAMVGQYLGAERKDDAYKVVWKSSGINMAVVGAMCTGTFFFGKEVTAFFINEPDVLVEGYRYFRIVSLSIPFFATFNIFDAALRGSGYTIASMILNIVRLWGIRLPLIYFFGLSMGTLGIWYAMLISNISIAIAAAFVISSKKWLKKVI